MNTKEEDRKSRVRRWPCDHTKEIKCEKSYQEFMLEEMIMKSNESESGCKTKLTNKLTNKTNVEQM